MFVYLCCKVIQFFPIFQTLERICSLAGPVSVSVGCQHIGKTMLLRDGGDFINEKTGAKEHSEGLGFDDTLHIADADHHLRQADALPAVKAGRLQELVNSVFD